MTCRKKYKWAYIQRPTAPLLRKCASKVSHSYKLKKKKFCNTPGIQSRGVFFNTVPYITENKTSKFNCVEEFM